MGDIVIKRVLSILMILFMSSCFNEQSVDELIEERYPIKTDYNRHMARKQLASVYKEIASSEKGTLSSGAMWTKFNNAFNCIHYFEKKRGKKMERALERGKFNSLLKNKILNNKNKLKKWLHLDSSFAGKVSTLPKRKDLVKGCMFKIEGDI